MENVCEKSHLRVAVLEATGEDVAVGLQVDLREDPLPLQKDNIKISPKHGKVRWNQARRNESKVVVSVLSVSG